MFKFFSLWIFVLTLFTGCSTDGNDGAKDNDKEKPLATYHYEEEEVLSFSVLKTKVYEDRLVVYFSEDALSDAEDVRCYDKDFELMDEEVDFDVKDDVLIVYSDNPQDINGLRIVLDYNWEYWTIRYLDSDKCAILQYTWADDWGYFCSGDEDAYYTQEEKDAQAKRAEENRAKRDAAMAKIAGTWINESGTLRMEIYFDQYPIIELYEWREDSWVITKQVNAYWVFEEPNTEPLTICIEDDRGYSYLYQFVLYNDMTECECEFTDERMKRVEE